MHLSLCIQSIIVHEEAVMVLKNGKATKKKGAQKSKTKARSFHDIKLTERDDLEENYRGILRG